MIQIRKEHSAGRIEKVSADERLVATYQRWSLGDKGRIWAKNCFPDRSYLGKVVTTTFSGVGYHLVESCAEYADLMRRFNWYITSDASAYSRKECFAC